MNVSAVVVTYRSKPCIDACLDSLLHAGVPDIWVVDNASDDGTVEHVEKKYPQVNLIKSDVNLGFAAGNNLALRRLASDFVLLLNPDAWLQPNALEKMLKVMRQDVSIAMVGPSIKRENLHEPSLLSKPSYLSSLLFFLSGMRRGSLSGMAVAGFPWGEVTDGDHIRGSCMLVRQQAIEEVGVLDESFFLYFEETEWCLRFRRKGWRIVIAPEAEAYHIGKASVQTQGVLPGLEFMRSGVIFISKQYPWLLQFSLRGTLLLMAITKYLLLLLVPSSGLRRQWLLRVAGLSVNPYRMPIVYDLAQRPKAWKG